MLFFFLNNFSDFTLFFLNTQCIFEPTRHSVRAYRQWEKKSGKNFRTLSVEERQKANREIDIMLKKCSSRG